MKRQQLIDKGKVWQVYPDSNPDNILFEGTITQCRKYIVDNNLMRDIKKGTTRLGKLIYESENLKP